MVVLGNARARDLPGIPGRAVWQSGLAMIEVQTPILGVEEANVLLAAHRETKVSQTPSAEPSQPAVVEER